MKRSWMPRRTTPMARGSTLARSRMKHHARTAVETARTHGDAEFRAWMKRQPCVICGRTPSDAAHIASGGVGRKDDVARTVPLCSDAIGYVGHHSEYDGRSRAGGKRTFLLKYQLARDDLLQLAADTHARYREAA
jgi:hypothetical protein